MNRQISYASLLALAGLVFALAPRTSVQAAEGMEAATSIRLQRVQELRRQELVKPDKNSFSMETPGLELKFSLSLPADRRLLEITNPERAEVKAVDASGRDLAAIEENFMNKLEYVKLIQTYGEDPKGFTVHLATPTRAAATFDLNVELEAVTFADTEDVSVELSEDWTQLDASMFGKKKVQVRIQRKGEETSLEIMPGTVKGALEDVQLFDGSTELEQGWSMWNESRVNYSFTGKATGPITARLTVRTGLSTEMLTIALEDQPLP